MQKLENLLNFISLINQVVQRIRTDGMEANLDPLSHFAWYGTVAIESESLSEESSKSERIWWRRVNFDSNDSPPQCQGWHELNQMFLWGDFTIKYHEREAIQG